MKRKKGRHVVIIGSADHPEVQGIMGWASGPGYRDPYLKKKQSSLCPRKRKTNIYCGTGLTF